MSSSSLHGSILPGSTLPLNRPLRVGIVGDFNASYPSHIATNEALDHAAMALSLTLDRCWLSTQSLDSEGSCRQNTAATLLQRFDALWCAPGSPYQNMNGALNAIRFARERDWPFVGT